MSFVHSEELRLQSGTLERGLEIGGSQYRCERASQCRRISRSKLGLACFKIAPF
jgi:hypothetical protein